MKLFVGNISWNVSEEQLAEHFNAFGEIEECKVIMDRETGRSRGFGFVTMVSDEDGNAAIEGLNGKELDGRALNVGIARERAPRSNHRGGGGGGNW